MRSMHDQRPPAQPLTAINPLVPLVGPEYKSEEDGVGIAKDGRYWPPTEPSGHAQSSPADSFKEGISHYQEDCQEDFIPATP